VGLGGLPGAPQGGHPGLEPGCGPHPARPLEPPPVHRSVHVPASSILVRLSVLQCTDPPYRHPVCSSALPSSSVLTCCTVIQYAHPRYLPPVCLPAVPSSSVLSRFVSLRCTLPPPLRPSRGADRAVQPARGSVRGQVRDAPLLRPGVQPARGSVRGAAARRSAGRVGPLVQSSPAPAVSSRTRSRRRRLRSRRGPVGSRPPGAGDRAGRARLAGQEGRD
jgi:hypothetical protein